MHISISGHHVGLTAPLRDYITCKMERLERHFDQITTTQVTLSVEKQRQKAEACIHVSGADIFAQSESPDMYASIDTLIDKLDRQILKHKEKKSPRHQSLS